ncbi:hypothetical protein DMB66_02670 [Actinoplanes sp. ATCC 53533]|nr:hypothetical protein DMB66_02670 [Actinoplanes sp. ATCC 53533]
MVSVAAWGRVRSKTLQRSTTWAAAPLLLASVIVGVVPAAASAVPAAAAPLRLPAAVTAQDEKSALRLAQESGTRVEVMSERTERSQFFAEPDGRLTYESAVLPQRVRRASGEWADVDLTLQRTEGGAVTPKASAADVRFSSGGKGPLVTLVEDKKTLTLSWSGGDLPAPTLSGATATYAEVLPGVDLVVRPTEIGFSHVLAIKSAAAAANPELRAVTFDVGGDARVSRLRDGSLQAVAGRELVASAPAPGMWDSRDRTTAAKSSAKTAAAVAGAADDPSTAVAAADTARTAVVQTEVTAAGDLVLKPDAAMLAGAATFPLFIDPDWSVGKKRWAYSTNNNTNNSDVSRARVGMDPDGRIYRSYFEFSTAAIKDKHVESAKVKMVLDHSWSCTNTWTSIFSANPISGTPRTAWKSSKPFLKHLGAEDSHANEGSGCSDSPQLDMTIDFDGAGVTSWLNGITHNGAATGTVAFSAGNATLGYENAKDRWKKFFPLKAKLIADVDARPAKPTQLQVNKVACKAGTTAIGIGITNPYFGAFMTDSDRSQALKSTWEWSKVTGATMSPMTAPGVTSTPAHALDFSARVAGAVTDNTYAFRVRATDPAPYGLIGAWSDWCYFRVDTSDPPVIGEELVKPEGPGKPGTYRITSTALDVVKFRYGWNGAGREVAAASWTNDSGKLVKAATVELTVLKYGQSNLELQAVDSTNNVGDGSIPISVDSPASPVAHWGLETDPSRGVDAALADRSESVGRTPLAGAGVGWTDGQRLVGGEAATFSGVGALATTGPVVDTTGTYAVAAWVRVGQTTVSQTIASQDDGDDASFVLQFRSDDRSGDGTPDKSFCFGMLSAAGSTPAAMSTVCAVNAAVAGRWTHVAGGYDATEKKMRLWINGVNVPEVAAPAAWKAVGPLRVGERKSAGVSSDKLYGHVADVQVFDRMLVDEDFTGKPALPSSNMVDEPGILTPINVGLWDFQNASACADPANPDGCDAPDGAAWHRTLRLTQGTDIPDGGGFAIFDNEQLDWVMPGEPGYGITTREYGLSQRNTALEGEPAQWQDVPVLRTDQSFTVSARVYVDSTAATMTAIAPKGGKQSAFYLGTRPSTVNGVTAHYFEAMVPSSDQNLGETYTRITAAKPLTDADEGLWTQLTLVYDAGAGTMTLYVSGQEKPAIKPVGALWNAAGPLAVGGGWYTPDNAAGAWTENWFGGIDDVHVYQGAMNAAQVRKITESPTEDES